MYVIGCDFGNKESTSVTIVGKIEDGVLTIVKAEEVDLRGYSEEDRSMEMENRLIMTLTKHKPNKLFKSKKTPYYSSLIISENEAHR